MLVIQPSDKDPMRFLQSLVVYEISFRAFLIRFLVRLMHRVEDWSRYVVLPVATNVEITVQHRIRCGVFHKPNHQRSAGNNLDFSADPDVFVCC